MRFCSGFEIKKVLLEYERLLERVKANFFKTFEPTSDAITRRNKLRRHHHMERATIVIQVGICRGWEYICSRDAAGARRGRTVKSSSGIWNGV